MHSVHYPMVGGGGTQAQGDDLPPRTRIISCLRMGDSCKGPWEFRGGETPSKFEECPGNSSVNEALSPSRARAT